MTHRADSELRIRKCGGLGEVRSFKHKLAINQTRCISEMRSPVNIGSEGNTRIWFLPDVYWNVTKGMVQCEIDALMAEVERLAEARDLDALRNYPFIFIGENCHRREMLRGAVALT